MRLVYKFNCFENIQELLELSKISKNLYNQANYIVKQEFVSTGKWIRYYDLERLMKITKNLENEINYYKFKAQLSQQILKQLDQDWNSFFRSIKDWSKNKDKYRGKPKFPSFKKEYNSLVYIKQSCQIKKDFIILNKKLKIYIPQYEKYKEKFNKFQQIRINYKKNFFEIEIIYNQEYLNEDLNKDKYCSIDLGIDNLLSCVTENKSLIFSGKIIKSVNQQYNKQRSILKSKNKRNVKETKRLNKITNYRNNFMRDYCHKITRILVNYCVKNRIGTIVVGYNKQWKDSINLGNKTNQTFVSIPFNMILEQIKYKCQLVGINFIQTEESYTSRCDSLALELVEKHDNYLGKRIKRGLFQSSVGRLINADINGAINILRKVIKDSDEVIQKIFDKGLLFNPIRIRNIFEYSKFLLS
jgi:putative transposase